MMGLPVFLSIFVLVQISHLCQFPVFCKVADLPASCKEVRDRLYPYKAKSGVYTVKTKISNITMDVYCDMDTDGGGWTSSAQL